MNPHDNIRIGFMELGERVHRALRVQCGDLPHMEAQWDNVRLFLQDVERVCMLLVTTEQPLN
jgi:hypothetical protein